MRHKHRLRDRMAFSQFPQSDNDEGLGPPPGPFQFPRRPNFPIPGGLLRWGGALVVVLILFIVVSIAKGIYADWLWFDSVRSTAGDDYLSVFRLRIVTRIWLFFAGAGIFLLFFGVNALVALRQASRDAGGLPPVLGDVDPAAVRRIGIVAGIAATLFLAVIFGVQAAGQWDNILLFMNSQTFGVEDPAFGRDIGFYLFRLPTLNFLVGWLLAVVILTTIVVGGLYASRLVLGGFSANAPALARPHVSLLLVFVLGLFVWRYWLSRFGLVYSERGAAFGAGWTDINAQLPVIYVLMALGSLTALLILVSIFRRGLLFLPVGATVLWVVVAIVGGLIYPATVQRFQVEPNELVQEREFIERNIEATRTAYGLDRIVVLPEELTPANDFVTAEEIAANPKTIQNIRLWDHRPLLTTLNQRQTFRPRYDFLDVDVDRYEIDGELRQVMLAARELNQEGLPEDARSWVNRRLQFTHGFGLAMVPVNEVRQEGLPAYFIEGLPPTGEIAIEQPRIYYGEMPEHYVVVNTDQDEFDFQGSGEQVRNRYDGEGGVRLSSFFRRLVYAWELADTNILISDAISDESRLLYRRNIQDRVEMIAPFLALDSDPYLVVADGQLFWVQDAYTHTDRYPYSTRTAGLNYIRNSVKIVISAFDGTVTFYLIEPDDPIARVYQGIYPDLFTPFADMPESLRDHLRYPQDLFRVQAEVYLTYHITDPDTFFNKEDIWDIPMEIFIDRKQPMEPYYVIMRLPGEEQEEFVLILPFLPAGKPNATAWLAARSDGDQYGKLLSFRFPTDKVISGPLQVDNRIDQNTTISQQISLWNTSGSQVIRGNLLMIPIGEGNLFVEPIYLQATEGQLPELKRVVVVNGNNIAMEETLERALEVVLGQAQASAPTDEPPPTTVPTPAPGETPPPAPTPAPTTALSGDLGDLIEQANDAFERAQELLQQGDFAGYGEEIERLEEILQRLMALNEGG
jgi:hypothetical protein